MSTEGQKIKSRRKILKSVAGAGSFGLLAGCTNGVQQAKGQDTYNLKLAEAATKESAHYKGSKLLADTIEKKSDERIKVDVICCGKAGGPPEITKSVNSGTMDMGVSAVNNLANLTSAWLFIQLPYLWKDHKNLYDFWSANYGDKGQGDVVKQVNKKAQQDLSNVKILDYWGSNGGSMRHLHFSDDSTPTVPKDAGGQKIRVTESPIEKTTVSNWDFSATPVAWSETVPAMKQGVVQGIHIHYWWLYASGMYKQINYTVETQTQDSPAILHMNTNSWNELPSDLQDVMTSAVKEVTPKQIEMDIQQGEKAKRLIKEKNPDITIHELSSSELNKWQQVTDPAYDEWLGKEGVPKEFVKNALKFQNHSVPGVDM